jgi:hypothetical protein
VEWQRAPTLEVAGDRAEVEALRLAVAERARVQPAALEREIVVLVAGVGDLEHDVGAAVDDERPRANVEVGELDGDHLGATARGSLADVGVGAVERVADPDESQQEQEGRPADRRRDEQTSPPAWTRGVQKPGSRSESGTDIDSFGLP